MKPEFIDTLFGFTSAMAIARNWLEEGIITKNEFEKLCKILTIKYEVSLGSILLDMS